MANFIDCVSIIFIHFSVNEERSSLARKSLKSLQETIHTPLEIMVVDNGENIEDSKFFLEECQNKRISLYIRNADNLHYALARNQAMKLVEGEYVVIVDDDLIYEDGWLEKCIWLLKQTFPQKMIASPLSCSTKGGSRWRKDDIEIENEKFNVNTRAGSNCMVMRKETMNDLGFFPIHPKSGSRYADRLTRKGYAVISPKINMAYDMGYKKSGSYWLQK